MTEAYSIIWRDITESHRELREKLEAAIDKFINTSEKVCMQVIIGPYGSGKSTILRYLTWWCWNKKRIPAIYANFSAIVDFMRSQGYSERNRVAEDQLHKIVEKFFHQRVKKLKDLVASKQWDEALKVLRDEFLMLKSGDEPLKYLGIKEEDLSDILSKELGVVFLDEIEETYSYFKSLVLYETSPLRGLADAIHERRTNLLVFIAYGPSTTAAEAISKATLWRVEVHSIPVIDSNYLHELLSREVDIFQCILSRNALLARGVSNLLWWLSKGRPAWAKKFVKSDFLHHFIEILNSKPLISLPSELRRLLIDEVHKGGSALIGELVEGIRPFEYEDYRRQLSLLKYDDERNLFTMLILLPTTIPQDILSKSCNTPTIPKSYWLFSSSELINVDAFAETLEQIVGSILERVVKTPAVYSLKRNAYWAAKVLSEVLANQYNEILLDANYFKELLEVISAYAQELYINDPEVSNAISKVNPSELYSKIKSKKIDAIRSTEEVHYAISPRVLFQIFPSLISTPLIGRAKIEEARLLDYFAKVLENPDRVFDLFEKMTRILIADGDILRKPLVVFLPTEFLKTSYEIIGKMVAKLSDENPYVLLFLTGEVKSLEELMSEELKGFMYLGTMVIEHLPPRSGLFLLGLFYNLANQGPSFVDELSSLEQTIYNSYKRFLVRNYILFSIEETYRRISEINNQLESSRIVKLLRDRLEDIARNAHAIIGTRHAQRIISNAHCSDGIELLAHLANYLGELYNVLEEWNKKNIAIKFNIDEIFKEIKLFVSTKGRFVLHVKETLKLLSKALNEDNVLRCICRALEYLLYEKVKEERRIDKSLEVIKRYTSNINVFREEFFARIINSYVVHNVLNKLDDEVVRNSNYFADIKKTVVSSMKHYIKALDTLETEINTCLNGLREIKLLLSEAEKELNLEVSFDEHRLVKQLNDLESFLITCQDIAKQLRFHHYHLEAKHDAMFRDMLLDEGILKRAIEGLEKFVEALRTYQELLQKISSSLTIMLDIVREHKMLRESLSKDLLNILSRDLKEIESVYKEIQKLEECISEIEDIRKSFDEKLHHTRNAIVNKLDQLLKLGGLKHEA